ncbi:MAG TPA: PEP-CTERM sorting domain-containing protein [Casimicrobiaceae bacterium]|jgi:hypothetical protein
MKRLLAAVATVALSIAPPAFAGLVFDYEQAGGTVVTDCAPGFPPQPLCAMIDANGEADDVPDVIPGQWLFHLQGQVLFFTGRGTFSVDDPSPANNDFLGTWTNVLFMPNAMGVAHSTFQWVVTGGTGLFAAGRGHGVSSGDVVVAPFAFDSQGQPLFAAACDRAAPGLGSYCDAGTFFIPEPPALLLLAIACAIATGARRRRGSA